MIPRHFECTRKGKINGDRDKDRSSKRNHSQKFQNLFTQDFCEDINYILVWFSDGVVKKR